MSTRTTKTAPAPEPETPLAASPVVQPWTAEQMGAFLKKGKQVLWAYRDDVEKGDILFITGQQVDLIWLEGYKSRNDTISFGDVLAVYDKNGPEHTVGSFTGPGFISEAGVKWQAEYLKAKAARDLAAGLPTKPSSGARP